MARKHKKNAQKANGGGQAMDTRQPLGQPSDGLVRKPQKEKKGKKGKAPAPIPSGRLSGRGKKQSEPVVESVPEAGIVRHENILKAHGDAVTAVVMAPDCVYTASRDKVLKRWKVQRDAQGRFTMTADLEVALGEVCWSLVNAGEWIFCGLGSGAIRAFSKAGLERTLDGHSKRVMGLLTHEHVLLSCSADSSVRCWQFDAASQHFACTHVIDEGVPGPTSCMAVLGSHLWVGGANGVSLVELSTLKVTVQPGPKRTVAGLLQFMGHMIVAYVEGSLCIFNSAGEKTHSQNPLPAGPALCVAGLDVGPRLLVGHSKGQVSSIALPMMDATTSWQALERCKVQCMCCAGHDGIFLLGAESGHLQLWQRAAGAAGAPAP